MSTKTTDTKSSLRLVRERPPVLEESLEREIKEAAARFGTGRKALVPVLGDIKRKRGHIPPAAIYGVSSALGVDYAKVHRVASFYTLLESIPGRLSLAS